MKYGSISRSLYTNFTTLYEFVKFLPLYRDTGVTDGIRTHFNLDHNQDITINASVTPLVIFHVQKIPFRGDFRSTEYNSSDSRAGLISHTEEILSTILVILLSPLRLNFSPWGSD